MVVEHLDNNYKKRIFNQMMLRFRPIAPRPVSVEKAVSLPVKEKRVKRKYVRAKNKNNKNKKTMKKVNEECNFFNCTSLDRTLAVVTGSYESEFVTNRLLISFNVSENNNNNNNNNNNSSNSKSSSTMSGWIPQSLGLHDADLATVVKRRESWITVESVMGSCDNMGRGLGYRDLETDRSPGFISNGLDEVQWVNLAYRRMVDPNPDDGAPPPEVSVRLMMKVEKIDFVYWPAFSCRVRVMYDLFNKKKQVTVPCDVWKMDSGGYAWRLDVEAALSLGRLN